MFVVFYSFVRRIARRPAKAQGKRIQKWVVACSCISYYNTNSHIISLIFCGATAAARTVEIDYEKLLFAGKNGYLQLHSAICTHSNEVSRMASGTPYPPKLIFFVCDS